MKRYVKCSSEEPYITFNDLCGNFKCPIPGNQTRNSESYRSGYQDVMDHPSVSKFEKLESETSQDLLYAARFLYQYITEKIWSDEEDEHLDKQIVTYSKLVNRCYEKYIGLIEGMVDKINDEAQSLGDQSYKCQRLKDSLIHVFRQTMITEEIRSLMESQDYYQFPN